ncbi:hypothetical protein ACOSP7_027661 [Xanthoceras sorbifolium]|uniref:J domain-containing protein n=1 Tax=Xanthoceras sorbifolium TaxID=99658 RepID=A0ABQ8HGK3_9ROSI|nr:hypothetical protein JRO89_XS11G0217300 [Xanthoceras sorbifolium]
MECNKDEALRAKKISERKVTERDFASAKKFALKAQTLYPGLEGIPQLLIAIDVHISAEKKINGEVDWYAVLGINPSVDDETARKQFQKVAMALHPDKNQAVGADGAFKLVLEAWRLLADKAKRLAYNEKLNPEIQLKHPVESGVPFAPRSANNILTSTANVTSQAHDGTPQTIPASLHSPSDQNPGTFWTECNNCSTLFEFLRVYLNLSLLCPHCNKAFPAIERRPPSEALRSFHLSSLQQSQNSSQPQNSNHHTAEGILHRGSTGLNSSNNAIRRRWGRVFKMSGGDIKNGFPSNATQADASVVQQPHGKYKKVREEAQAAQKKRRIYDNRKNGSGGEHEEAQAALQKQRMYDNRKNGYGGDMAMRNGVGSGSISESRKGSFEAGSTYGFFGIYNKPSRRDLSLFDIRNVMVRKAQVEIRKNLENSRSVTNAKTTKERESRKQKNMDNGDLHDLSEHGVSITVPDSDFHNFDLDRTDSFGDDQVWAAYDDDDGMPRYYARIHKVVTLKPFKMQISWLDSKSNSELGPLHWIDSGFTKTCGYFRAGKAEISGTLNSFSHNVKWIKGKRGVIHIFPSKGDVWALYRNWSPDWNAHTPDEVIHKYDMVEVLDDYSEEQGVSVTPLVKVDGFKTVFRKHMDPKEVRRIPKVEMFRFSHQVPSCLLTGQEAQNAPAGCWELDPAATPLELLLQPENGGKVTEEMLQNAPNIK